MSITSKGTQEEGLLVVESLSTMNGHSDYYQNYNKYDNVDGTVICCGNCHKPIYGVYDDDKIIVDWAIHIPCGSDKSALSNHIEDNENLIKQLRALYEGWWE